MRESRHVCATRVVWLAVFLASLASLGSRAGAWSYKEHIQFSRLAASRLIADPTTPPEMKAWLERAVPQRLDLAGEQEFLLHARVGRNPSGYTGILYWSFMPDEHAQKDPKDAKVQPYGAHERLMHYIDLELFLAGNAKREYRGDLSAKPAIDDIPRDPHDPRFLQAGYLPLRAQEMYDKLVRAIRDGRLEPTSAGDTDHAIYYAGYLAHYLADNTQPQHATIDYKSQSYFRNPRRAPNIHSAVEYLMIDDELAEHPELRREYWPLFARELEEFRDPIATDDLFRATLEVAMSSYDALPLIGEAAAAATSPGGANDKSDVLDLDKFFRHRGTVAGRETSVMEMKARQTAWAVKRIERVWRQAWREAKGS